MKYYIDFEFNERFIKPLFKPKFHTIEPISLGIVCEDGRELEIVFNDFDLKAAWNKFQSLKDLSKEYWLRDNVLNQIQDNLSQRLPNKPDYDGCDGLRRLLNMFGKNKNEAAILIKEFCTGSPQFYGYYSDYDWVILCQIFGTMMDLPSNFPMYCNNLKQTLDQKVKIMETKSIERRSTSVVDFETRLESVKSRFNYPKQTNEHSSLHAALWNKKLDEFLIKII